MNKYIFFIIIILLPSSIKASDYKAVVDITALDIYEIQEAVDNGYLTYELLTRLYLDRIEAYNDTYNAIISINEEAIEQAKEADIEYQKNGRTNILFGIPVILKDNIDYIGLATTAGTTALSDSYPLSNSDIVQNLLDNGCIILGKSNMSEFAFSALTSYSSYGTVRNAYNSLYTSYGSSGGSAVSIALSFATIAVGTDTNSSIRLPASANNVVGLRPTYGLLSNTGIIAYDSSRDTSGPITKTVSDNAILLTALASNSIDYTSYLDEDGLSGKTVGILTQFIEEDTSSSIATLYSYYDEIDLLMESAIETMEESGAIIVYIDDFYSSYYQSINNNSIMGYMFCYDFNQYIENTTSLIKSYSELLSSGGYIQDLDYYNVSCTVDSSSSTEDESNELKEEYRDYVESIMEEYGVDVLVYPNTKNKLIKISNLYSSTLANVTATISSTTGFPAISVPLGFDSDDLPYGIEFLALANQENILYEVAYSFEQATNNSITPEDAPSLYEVSEYVDDLKEVYENDNIKESLYTKESYQSYLLIHEKVIDYLTNYSLYELDTSYEKELLNNYVDAINNLTKKKNNYYYLIIPIILILFTKFKKHKKKRH